MNRFLLFIVPMCCVNMVHSNTLIDSALVNHCRRVFYETVSPYEAETHGGSIIVSETETGNVKALINFNRHGINSWSENTSTDCFVPALNSPLALLLALLDAGADPEEPFYTTGVLLDERSGVLIRDWNWRYGGVGNITLSKACQRSRVSMIEACEQYFCRSMATAAYHLSHTGIDLGDCDTSLKDYQSFCDRYEESLWQPLSLLGMNDKLKVIQIHMFTSGFACKGKLLMPRFNDSDPSVVIYHSMANPKHINIVRKSMIENVENGLSKKAKSGVEDVKVYGFSNVSDPDGAYGQTSLFTGFIDGYTITVSTNMFAGNALIRILPQRIAASIIKFLTDKQGTTISGEGLETYKPYRAEK